MTEPTPQPVEDQVLAAARAASEALAAGDIETLVSEAGRAADLAPPADPRLRFRAASVLQAAFRFTGRPELFERALAECRAVGDRTDHPELAIPARALGGNVLLLAGRYHQALDACEAALALADATGLGEDRVVGMGHQFRGYILLEWNRLAEAAAALTRAWEVTEAGDRGVRSGVARVMAEVALIGGDRAAAAGWIGRLTGIVAEPMTLRNREWLAAVRIRHGFAATRDLQALDDWQRRHDYRPEALATLPATAAAARLHEFAHLLTLLETTGQWRATASVAAAIERGSGPLRRWYLARALSARAVALDALGQTREAATTWAAALAAGEDGGFVRVYLDGSRSRLRLLHGALAEPHSRSHARRVLAAAGVETGLPPDLTSRQLAVLKLVADGLADREIGLAAGVSLATVKTHLRAIYSRLGVGSRTAAVARARDVGLL